MRTGLSRSQVSNLINVKSLLNKQVSTFTKSSFLARRFLLSRNNFFNFWSDTISGVVRAGVLGSTRLSEDCLLLASDPPDITGVIQLEADGPLAPEVKYFLVNFKLDGSPYKSTFLVVYKGKELFRVIHTALIKCINIKYIPSQGSQR